MYYKISRASIIRNIMCNPRGCRNIDSQRPWGSHYCANIICHFELDFAIRIFRAWCCNTMFYSAQTVPWPPEETSLDGGKCKPNGPCSHQR